MQATVRLKKDDSLEGLTESGHQVVMDRSPDVGGQNLGSRPMEMLLLGLGGCAMIDVVLILRKARQALPIYALRLMPSGPARCLKFLPVFTCISWSLANSLTPDGLIAPSVCRRKSTAQPPRCSIR